MYVYVWNRLSFSHYLKLKLFGGRKEHFLLYISSGTCKIRERTQVQVVYLEGGPRKHRCGTGERETGTRGTPTTGEMGQVTAVGSQGSVPAGTSENPHETHLRIGPQEDGGAG